MQRLNERLTRSQKAYLARHLRRRLDERPHHGRFRRRHRALQEPMRAVAKALGDRPRYRRRRSGPGRPGAAFFQQIPYAALEDRAAGRRFPARPGPAGPEPRRLRQQGRGAGGGAADLYALAQTGGHRDARSCHSRRRSAAPGRASGRFVRGTAICRPGGRRPGHGADRRCRRPRPPNISPRRARSRFGR